MKKTGILAIMLAMVLSISGCGSKDTQTQSTDVAKQVTAAETKEPATSTPKSSQPDQTATKAEPEKPATQVQPAKNDAAQTSSNKPETQSNAEKPAKAASQPAVAHKPASPGKADLWVTQDFGAKVLMDKVTAVAKGSSVLDLVGKELKIETAYGGQFINSINGLESGYTGQLFGGKKMDWFYWVNGIMVAEGAGAYSPRSGDTIWWDYHDWGAGSFVTSVVGAYPQPFVNGFDGSNSGTVVAYDDAHLQQANLVVAALKANGVKSVSAAPLSQVDLSKRTKMTIVIGQWQNLDKNQFLQDMNKNNRKTGIYANFAADEFIALDLERNEVGKYKTAGAIVATGRGLGDKNPLWLVCGTDDAGLKAAVNVLCNRPQVLKRQVGVLVHGNEVIGLPVR